MSTDPIPDTEQTTGDSRQIQEDLYRFPYHHIIGFDVHDYSGFCQFRNSPSGYRYASYLIATLEEVARYPFGSLVDIGCGDGYFLRRVAERFGDRELVGIDLSERAIAFARLINSDPVDGRANIEFLCRDIVREPLDRQFDVATSVAVLEHIPPELLHDFLAASARLLRVGGKFVVALPSKNLSIKNIKRHYQHFDEESATAMLSPHFRVLKCEYLNNDRPWGRVIARLLTNPLFILNHAGLREWLFKLYVRRFLHCARPNGSMLLLACERR